MPVSRFERSALPATPWKNGGGLTREVLCLPAGSDFAHFDWRVSIAHIAASGPFSAFPGIDRVITLLDGPGAHLHSTDGAIDHRLDTPLQPFAFAGEASIQAELLGAACDDLNVMTRRDRCSAQVKTLRAASTLPATGQGLLLAVHGSWVAQGDTPQRLQAGQGLWWHGTDIAWQLDPQVVGVGTDAAMIAVLIGAATA